MNEDISRKAIDLGMKAKTLLDNETLNQWWESADKNLFKQFKLAKQTDKVRLEEIKALQVALASMRRDFTRYVSLGDKAKSKIGDKKPKIPNPFG